MGDRTLYDEDILIWSEQQAAALRSLASRRDLPNELDLANVIEEIEDAGRSRRSRGDKPCAADPRVTWRKVGRIFVHGHCAIGLRKSAIGGMNACSVSHPAWGEDRYRPALGRALPRRMFATAGDRA